MSAGPGALAKAAPSRALRAERQRAYTDPAVHACEVERVFDAEWVLVGRAGAIPEPGDYMTARAGRRPIVAVRQRDGGVRAFGNYCLHRYARLLDGRGCARRIVCPYHAWTYDMSGALIGITDPEGFVGVDKRGLRLGELACEEWLGFVFVSARRDLPPVARRLAPLAAHLERYDLGAFEDRCVIDEEIWDGNWKLVFENFVECYHVTYAHGQSIGPTNPTSLAEMGPRGEPHFSIHHNPYRDQDLPPVHNPALDADERRRLHVIGIYPNGLAAIDPNFMWWIMLEPLGVDRTNARWGLSFAPEAMRGMDDPGAYVEAIREVIGIATVEDKEIVARVQDGAAYGSAEPGYLHGALEAYVDEFRGYVARMTGA